MNARTLSAALGAVMAAAALAACETTDTHGAAAEGTTRVHADQKVNPACEPGDTPAGTASGLRCTPGSNTASPPGIDSNVEGASTSLPAPQ